MTSLSLLVMPLFDVTQHPVGFLCHSSILFTHIELVFHQNPQVPFYRAACQMEAFLNEVLRPLENIYISKGVQNLMKNRVCISGVQKDQESLNFQLVFPNKNVCEKRRTVALALIEDNFPETSRVTLDMPDISESWASWYRAVRGACMEFLDIASKFEMYRQL